jgi:adenylate cyclase
VSVKGDIESDIASILSRTWDVRDGVVVPSTADVKLGGGGVKLDAVMLYADLADSTELVLRLDRRVVAKTYKCFLAAASRLIKYKSGYIRSFDGDRVMGIFLGNTKCSAATACGLHLKWAFDKIVKPSLLAKYANMETATFRLNYSVGIDVSDVLVVRGGVFADNDLLWVGRAANVAAKLSSIREAGYTTFITEDVYKRLNVESKFADGKDMWTPFQWHVVPGLSSYYKSAYRWAP